MKEQERVKQWLLETVRLMVDRPDDVTIEVQDRDDFMNLRVNVHPSDIGKLIGASGRTARSLRIIGAAIAMTRGTRFALDIARHLPVETTGTPKR